MPNARQLSDQELIDTAHGWRRLALAGISGAFDEARRHEVELRRRLGALNSAASSTSSSAAETGAMHEARLPLAAAEIADQFVIATADGSTRSADALRDLLHNLRTLLDMDIAFVAEIVNDRQVFLDVDHVGHADIPIKAGESMPLEATLCQRVIDGRLPEGLADARTEPFLAEIAATTPLDIGAYLSTPVVLRDGRVYGTLCCISHTPRSAIGNRQIDALRHVAGIIASELEKRRG